MEKPNKEKNILRFVFDEMDEKEASSFLSELCTDDELWDTYEEVDGTVEALKDAELAPAQSSIDAIMEVAKETNPLQEENKGWLNKQLSKLNLHTVLASAMLVFVLAGVAGSVYKIRRSNNISPDTNNVSQKLPDTPKLPSTQDPKLEWEPIKIDQGLDDVRLGIENLIKNNKL